MATYIHFFKTSIDWQSTDFLTNRNAELFQLFSKYYGAIRFAIIRTGMDGKIHAGME